MTIKNKHFDPLQDRWTSEKPTQPGWYWWRIKKGSPSSPIKIGRFTHAEHSLEFQETETGEIGLLRGLRGKFYGPLTPPEG